MPTIREQRDALVSALTTQIGAGTVGSMTQAQLLNQSALHIMLDKVAATDPMVADAAALLGAVTASELNDLLVQAQAQTAFDTAINTAGSRAEILANSVARTAIAGSTRAVQRLTTSATFDAFLADSTMRTALFGSSTARAAILASSTLRAFLLGTPTAGNVTLAIADTDMRAAMYADATTRTAMVASSTIMDAVWANTTARDAAFNDTNMRAAAAGSATAVTSLMANATARQAAWANANMAAALAGSATALGVIDDTQAHMDEALSSTYSTMRSALITDATARSTIAASGTWMRRCVAVSGFIAAAFADAGFLAAWRSGTGLTAAEIPTLATSSASLTESTFYAGNEGWKACDSTPGTTAWWASSAAPQWIKYDFGSGKSVHLHSLVLERGSSTGVMINAFTLEGSNDNSAWTTVMTGNAANATGSQVFAPAVSVGYRYYRLTATSTHSSTPSLGNFDVKGFEVQ